MATKSDIKLFEFDPETVGDNRICLFIGRRGSGKSTAMRAMLYYKRKIPAGICMSETEESNRFWCQSIPKSFIFPSYKTDAVLDMIETQRAQHKLSTDGSTLSPVFWVAEDVMGSGELSKCKQARRVFTNGRQWGIFCLIALQNTTDLPPRFRGQVDYLFTFRALSAPERERLYGDFFSAAFDSYDEFVACLKKATNDYGCLVLDATKPTNKLDEQVFYWKAPEAPPFKAGSREYWQWHLMNYKADEGDDEPFESDVRRHQIRVRLEKKDDADT